jgi:hypothetical protein
MKIEYQNEEYREIISEEFVSKKFDAYVFREKLRSDARSSQDGDRTFKIYLSSSFENINKLLDKVLNKSPFAPNSGDFKKLKISLLLNALTAL